MKNYFKKFSIMVVMLLSILGVGVIQNGTMANAAIVGQQLTSPESGWTRYDDTNSKIGYIGTTWSINRQSVYYNGIWHYCYDDNSKIVIKFYGTKFRFIGDRGLVASNRAGIINVKIDGVFDSSFSQNGSNQEQTLNYEKLGLNLGVHTIEIQLDQSQISGTYLILDAIDIDSTGQLLSYNESISLDKSTMNLNVGDSQQLTATTTPSGASVTWTSSDTSIATVDSGKVTGGGAGTCTITATTADGLTATCNITVTAATEPTEPTGDANLFIELVDGQIKQYSVSQDEINKFTTWFENRDKDHSLSATYKFTKGTYTDYVVHDQIDWFEVR